MSQVRDIIQLVESAINSGIARVELNPGTEKNLPLVRFILAPDLSVNQPQYIGEVKDGRDREPVAVTVARRLAAGNLNLDHLEELVSSEAFDLVKKVDLIQFRQPGEPKDQFERRFDRLAQIACSKDVQIFRLDQEAPDASAVNMAKSGGVEAVLSLDESGHYQRVTSVTVPDTFSLQSTLQSVAQKQIVHSGDVLRMSGKSYVSDAGYFRQVDGFFGLNKPAGPRRNPLQEMSLADLFK